MEKKSNLKKSHFDALFMNLKLEKRQTENIVERMLSTHQDWKRFSEISLVSELLKTEYLALIQSRINTISSSA